MKIYTKKGDQGKTYLLGNEQIMKSEVRIRAYGHVDELNANIGLLIAYVKDLLENQKKQDALTFLELIQFQLFHIGSHLACTNQVILTKLSPIQKIWIENLEQQIDQMTECLLPLKNFIIPGGSKAACQAHICRVTSRRAECICVNLNLKESVDPLILAYLNRMSDYFFVLSRYINHIQNVPDVIWTTAVKE